MDLGQQQRLSPLMVRLDHIWPLFKQEAPLVVSIRVSAFSAYPTRPTEREFGHRLIGII